MCSSCHQKGVVQTYAARCLPPSAFQEQVSLTSYYLFNGLRNRSNLYLFQAFLWDVLSDCPGSNDRILHGLGPFA